MRPQEQHLASPSGLFVLTQSVFIPLNKQAVRSPIVRAAFSKVVLEPFSHVLQHLRAEVSFQHGIFRGEAGTGGKEQVVQFRIDAGGDMGIVFGVCLDGLL